MAAQQNKFCLLSDLVNEATVETRIVEPLLSDLGYQHRDIRLKTSISELAVGKGSKRILYKPDYVLTSDGIPTVVLDAKSPKDSLDTFETQCSSYCLEINRSYDYNPVIYFVLTNGIETRLYEWDKREPVLLLGFSDLLDGSQPFAELRSLLSRAQTTTVAQGARETIEAQDFEFKEISLAELHNKFQRMHKIVWQAEKKGPSAAFEELMKVIFVKIEKDRQLHNLLGNPPRPKYRDVVFSTHWIASQTESVSPINEPLFTNLVKSLEADIATGKRKRIFENSEELEVSPETIRKIVQEIEHVDFFAMEEDIHGRMFEAFLDATVRGKDIGQFFTPRDIVDFMVRLANPTVVKHRVDTVLDACCGSGGFLINAMSSMLAKAGKIRGLSSKERHKLQEYIVNQCLYGIDAGSDPAMYRIARMNMYLHGDGGSHIYYADALNKNLGQAGKRNVENVQQLQEVQSLILKQETKFDVILSNPPFSLQYSRDDSDQAEIMEQYDVSIDRTRGRILTKLLSSVMFLERYRDLVAPGGKVLAVIDESVLSGSSYKHVREYVRKHFLIRAIISLPGDTFRRASARVKTSILILQPRTPGETQEDVFMAATVYVGIEPRTARRIGICPRTLEAKKREEVETIVSEWKKYGNGENSPFVFPYSSIMDRMDVKYCVRDRGRKKPLWQAAGLEVVMLGKVLKKADSRESTVFDDRSYQLLRVSYDGEVSNGDLVAGEECSYGKLYSVEGWDLLLSNIGVGRGATAVVPPYHGGKWVSNEYTILRAITQEEAVHYSNLLRTKEILGDILSSSTGMNRGRIKWELISKVEVPAYDPGNTEITKLVGELEAFWLAHSKFTKRKQLHVKAISSALGVEDDSAHERWLAYKPPE